MNDPIATPRVEVNFSASAEALMRDLVSALLTVRAPATPVAPEVAADKLDALDRIVAELEAEDLASKLSQLIDQSLSQEPTVPEPESCAASERKSLSAELPPLDPAIYASGRMTSPEQRLLLLAHIEAGAIYGDLAKAMGVPRVRLLDLAVRARRDRELRKGGVPQKKAAGRPGRFTPADRAAFLARHEAGETIKSLAASAGIDTKAMTNQLFRAREVRAKNGPSSALPPQVTAPAVLGKLTPPAAPIAEPTTVRTLDQHRAVVAAMTSAKPVAAPPPPPRPPAAPPRAVRRDLQAAMAEFEAKKGVTRIPSGPEFAAVGVPMAFNDEADAIEWLTRHGHKVSKGPGMGAMTVDGQKMPRTNFPQRAAAIAREYGMKLIAQRKGEQAA